VREPKQHRLTVDLVSMHQLLYGFYTTARVFRERMQGKYDRA